jgi:protein NrfD
MSQAVISKQGAVPPASGSRTAGSRFSWRLTDIIWIVGLILLAIGAFGMWQRLAAGLAPSALTSYVPWGLWVGFYDYFVWIEVGSLLVFTSLVYLGGQERLGRLKPIVLFSGFSVLLMALMLVLLDLGHPLRFWHVLLYPDFNSMITWMVWLHMAYLLVLVVEIGLALWGKPGHGRILKALALLSLPIGFALILVSGSIFGVVAARPLWNTASLPLMFLVSALASGSSLLLLLTVLFWPDKRGDEYKQVVGMLARLTRVLLIAGVVAAAVIAFTILYNSSGAPARLSAITLILTGPYWWSFWVLHIGLGVVIPLLILFYAPQRPVAVGLAAVLSTVTFVAVTLNIVVPVLVTPELSGLSTAFVDPKLSLEYVPNAMEWLVLAFVIGLGALVYGLGLRFLPLQRERTEVSHD